jgi:hypothetical protein
MGEEINTHTAAKRLLKYFALLSNLYLQPLRCLHVTPTKQCFGTRLDPDSIRSVDPDPDSKSGSRRANMTHKKSKKLRNPGFLSA